MDMLKHLVAPALLALGGLASGCGGDDASQDRDLGTCFALTCPSSERANLATCSCEMVDLGSTAHGD